MDGVDDREEGLSEGDGRWDTTQHSDQAALDVEKSAGDKTADEKLHPMPTKVIDEPEGGLKGWLCVLAGFCGFFVSFGYINAIGILQTRFEQNELAGYSSSAIGWIGSIQVFLMNSGSIVVGPLFDWYGPRILVLVGTFMSVFGLMMMSLSTEYYQFLLSSSLCLGWGLSLIFTCCLAAVSTHFKRLRATALGITVSGSGLGGVCYPIMLKRLFDSVGFPWACRITAFVMLGCLVVTNIFLRSKLKHTGYKPGRKFFAFRALRERSYLLTLIAAFLAYWGLFATFTFLPLFSLRAGLSSDTSFYTVAFLNCGSVLGRMLPNIIADRYLGHFNTITVMVFITAILVLTMWLNAKSEGVIIAYGVLYGFASGGFVAMYPAVVAIISPISEIGARFGTISALCGIGALTSLPIFGALTYSADQYAFGFWPMIVFSGVTMLSGGVMYFFAKMAVGKGHFWVKI